MKLGADSLWAIDIDEQALWATRENAQRNGVEKRLTTGLPAELPSQTFDLLLANILANPLIELAPTLARSVRAGGDIVLSGILAAQAGDVRVAYEPFFALSETVEQDGWVRLHGKKI